MWRPGSDRPPPASCSKAAPRTKAELPMLRARKASLRSAPPAQPFVWQTKPLLTSHEGRNPLPEIFLPLWDGGGGGRGEEAKRDPRIESRATPGERQNRSLAAPRRPGGARGSARRCLSPALGKAGPPTARGRAAVPAGAGSAASRSARPSAVQLRRAGVRVHACVCVCMVCACAHAAPGPSRPSLLGAAVPRPRPFPTTPPARCGARVSRSSRSDGKFAQQPRGRAGLSTRAAEREGRGEEGEASDSRATAAAAPTRRSLPGHGLGWRPGDPRPPACPSCPLCAGQTVALALRLRFCPALARLLLFIRLGK